MFVIGRRGGGVGVGVGYDLSHIQDPLLPYYAPPGEMYLCVGQKKLLAMTDLCSKQLQMSFVF